jgi:hypothetical protein
MHPLFHCRVSRGKTVKIKSGRSLHQVMPKEHGVPEISDLLLKHYLTLHSSLFPTPYIYIYVCIYLLKSSYWFDNPLVKKNSDFSKSTLTIVFFFFLKNWPDIMLE